MITDFNEATDAIGWCEHGALDGDTCEHCIEDAEALGETPQPWRLMVLALTASLVPPEPALKCSVRVHMAPKENAA